MRDLFRGTKPGFDPTAPEARAASAAEQVTVVTS
jgi:hypothetical protein